MEASLTVLVGPDHGKVVRVVDDLIVFFTDVRCSKLRKRVGIGVSADAAD